MRKRILAAFMAACLILQTQPVLAAEAAEQREPVIAEEEILSEAEIGEEDSRQNEVTKEDIVSEESVTEADEARDEPDPAEGEETAFIAAEFNGNGSDYVIDEACGIALDPTEKNTFLTSYTADIRRKAIRTGAGNDAVSGDFYLLYAEASKEDALFPGQAVIDMKNADDLEPLGMGIISFGFLDEYEDNKRLNGICGAPNYASGESGDPLKPSTTYQFRVACKIFDDAERKYKLHFVSLPEEFTTKEPVTESAVGLEDFGVTSTGYSSVHFSWHLNNPENEFIVEAARFRYKLAGGAWSEIKNAGNFIEEQNWCTTSIHTARQAFVFQPVAIVYTGDPAVRTPVYMKEYQVDLTELKDISAATITPSLQVMSDSVKVSLQLTPDYDEVTYTGSMWGETFWREAGSNEEWHNWKTGYNNEGAIISDLKPGTTYDYYIELAAGDSDGENVIGRHCLWHDGSADTPKQFTTEALVTYDKNDFPDPILWKAIYWGINYETNVPDNATVTSAEVESIYYLDYFMNQAAPDEKVSSLEGLEKLKGLRSVNLRGHTISDASVLEQMPWLTGIDLSGNDLTIMPDLSGLDKLDELCLDSNLLAAADSGLSADKLPAAFKAKNATWVEDTRKAQRNCTFAYTVAPKYYAIGETHPFIIGFKGLAERGSYQFQIKLGEGIYETSLDFQYGAGLFNIQDLTKDRWGTGDSGIVIEKEKPTELTISLMRVSDREKILDNEKVTVTFMPDVEAMKPIEVKSGEGSFWFRDVALSKRGTYNEKLLLKLYDKRGRLAGSGSSTINDIDEWASDSRYGDLFDINGISIARPASILGTTLISAYNNGAFAEGYYDLSITNYDNDEYWRIEDAVHVTKGTDASYSMVYAENQVPVPEKIILNRGSGETVKLSVLKEKANSGAPIAATWKSLDEDVAAVSVSGKVATVRPMGIGHTTIVAHVKDNGYEEDLRCFVQVNASLSRIIVQPASLTMTAGDEKALTVLFDPVDMGAAVSWSSDSDAVAAVDTNGKVTAVAYGTATITASAGGKTASCDVTVKNKIDESTLVIPENICAVTNLHTQLKDVALPEGWTWTDGTLPLKSFVGSGDAVNTFLAQYSEEGAEPVTKEIPVSITTLSKVTVRAEKAVVGRGDDADLYADLNILGNALSGGFVKSIEWESSAPAVANIKETTVDGNGYQGAKAVITGEAAGTASITAKVTLGGQVGTEHKTVTVVSTALKVTVAEKLAKISFGDVKDGVNTITGTGSPKVYMVPFEQGKTVSVNVESTADKLTVKSSDASVAAPGAVQKDNTAVVIPVTLKKAGYVNLEVTANDTAKTSGSIGIYVKDPTPNLSVDTIVMNNMSELPESFYIYPNEEYEITAAKLCSADGKTAVTAFTLERTLGTDVYTIGFGTDPAVEKGTYKMKLLVNVAGVADAYAKDFTVKVESRKPALKTKQTSKVNLFYTDYAGDGVLTLTSDAEITNVSLKDCDFECTYAAGECKLSLKDDKKGTAASGLDKKGTLVVTYRDFKQAEVPFTVAFETKAPKLAPTEKAATLYPGAGIVKAAVGIKDTATGELLDSLNSSSGGNLEIRFAKSEAEAAYTAEVSADGKTILFTRTDSTFAAKANVTLSVKKSNYSNWVNVSYSISVNKNKPTLVLGKKALTLNKNEAFAAYEADQMTVRVKDVRGEAATADTFTIRPDGAAAEAEYRRSIVFDADPATGLVRARLHCTDGLEKGTYKFKLSAMIGEQEVTAAISVKVVDEQPVKTVKLSAKGSIDAVNRTSTSILYTPKLSNVTGTVTDVSLGGKFANLFDASVVGGNIEVKAKEDVALVSKYNYTFTMRLTLQNETGRVCQVETGEVKVKITQSKPKTTLRSDQTTLFNMMKNSSIPVTATALNKDGTAVTVRKVELTNYTDTFSYEDGALTGGVKADGTLSIRNRGKAVKGKTYALKFNVYYKDGADNEKPVAVTYKLKVN